jgi:histidinol phosphatase-like enzyme
MCWTCGKQVAVAPTRFAAVLAFDCDGTINISGGPIPLGLLKDLSRYGLAVYVVSQSWACASCGLPVFAPYDRVTTLSELRRVVDADRYIYVGDSADDFKAAQLAGWEFIYAKDFVGWISQSLSY